jgi:group I intron endonuclease
MRQAFHIYRVTCLTTEKAYIGLTTMGVARRWRFHLSSAKRGASNNLARAIRKYGAEDFEVMHVASSLDANAMGETEQVIIRQDNTLAPYGYNITPGGDGIKDPSDIIRMGMSYRHLTEKHKSNISRGLSGRTVSSETRKKIAASLAGRSRPEVASKRQGTTISEETRAKLRVAQQARFQKPEQRERISHALKGRPSVPLSVEARAKISASKLGKKRLPEHVVNMKAGQLARRARENIERNTKQESLFS